MSNKVNRPKGYTERSTKEITAEFNNTCFSLGQEIANQDRSESNQETLRERLKQLGDEFVYAQRSEARKADEDRKSKLSDIKTDAGLESVAVPEGQSQAV